MFRDWSIRYLRELTPRRSLTALLLLTLAVRGSVLGLSPQALEEDPDGYRAVAENLVEHGTFGRGDVPTAYRPPLYPLLLAPCVALGAWGRAAIGLLHLGLGIGTVWLTFRLAGRWGLGPWAWAAASLVALDPILLRQSTLVRTVSLATVLAVAALALLTASASRPTPGRVLAAGGSVALAALCRPTFLPWLGMAAVVLPWAAGKSHGPQPVGLDDVGIVRYRVLKVFFAFAVGAGVVLLPWIARNQVEFGRPIVSTTHGGYTLWLANNPDLYEYLRTGPWGSLWNADEFNRVWRAESPQGTPADELAADRLAYSKAWEAIRRQPGAFLYSCLVRLGRFWSPVPHQLTPDESLRTRLARYAVGVWYVGGLLLAVVGLVVLVCSARRSASKVRGCESESPLLPGEGQGEGHPDLPSALGPLPLVLGLLMVLCFMGVHTLYWTDMRMRAPLTPVLAMAAAVGAAWCVERFRQPK